MIHIIWSADIVLMLGSDSRRTGYFHSRWFPCSAGVCGHPFHSATQHSPVVSRWKHSRLASDDELSSFILSSLFKLLVRFLHTQWNVLYYKTLYVAYLQIIATLKYAGDTTVHLDIIFYTKHVQFKNSFEATYFLHELPFLCLQLTFWAWNLCKSSSSSCQLLEKSTFTSLAHTVDTNVDRLDLKLFN